MTVLAYDAETFVLLYHIALCFAQMSVDLLAGRPVELEQLMEMPLQRAQAYNIAAPNIATQLEMARAVVKARKS